MRAMIVAVAALLAACTTTREREARAFVNWDAISDARSSASDACGGAAVLIDGAEGYSAADYRCVSQPETSPPKTAILHST